MARIKEEQMLGVINSIIKTSTPEEEAEPVKQEELLKTLESKELREALIKRVNSKRGRPRTKVTGGKVWSRATFVVEENLLEKLRVVALREGLTQKEIIEEMFSKRVSEFESKNGIIHPEEYNTKDIFK